MPFDRRVNQEMAISQGFLKVEFTNPTPTPPQAWGGVGARDLGQSSKVNFKKALGNFFPIQVVVK
jgi:hypothetical protein